MSLATRPVTSNYDEVLTMLILKKQQKFYGVSPFYFALMPVATQYLFRDILEREIPELVEPFIDSLIEIENAYHTYYSGTIPEHLTEEDKQIIYSPQVTQTMLHIYNNCLAIHLEELKNIAINRFASSGNSAGLSLGHIQLDDFIRMTSQGRNDYIDKLVRQFDTTDLSLNRKEDLGNLRDLLEKVNISIEVVSRRVGAFEAKNDKAYSPSTIFSQVSKFLEMTDEQLFKEVSYRSALKEIGLDVTMCGRKFKTSEPAIKKLKTAKYNSSKIMLLLFCKSDLEKLRTHLMSKLSEYTTGLSRPRLFF